MPRSNAKLLVSGSALRGFNLGAQIVVAFFLTPFVIHSLGDRMYGFWALVAMFIGYYGLMSLGLGAGVSRYMAAAAGKGDREESIKVFSTALQWYTILGLVVLVVAAATAFLSPHFVHPRQDAVLFGKVILVTGMSLAVTFPTRAYSGLLNGELRLDALAVVDILSLLLRTASIVIVLLAGYKILALAWVTFLTSLPGSAAYVALSRRQCPWLRFQPQRWLGEWTKRLFSYAGFALMAKAADEIRGGGVTFVIAGLLGLTAVTHYRIAAIMITYFTSLMFALAGTVAPWFSRKDGCGDYDAIRKMFLLTTKLSLAVAGFVGFGFLAWGKPFIERWMGPHYLDAYPCLALLALEGIISLGQSPIAQLLYATSQLRYFAYLRIALSVTVLGLSLWLVRPLGIVGAAVASLVPSLVANLIPMALLLCHVSGIPVGYYMRELGTSCLKIGAALVVPALISARFEAPNYFSLVVVGLASAACYGVAIVFFHLTKQDRATIRRTIFSGPSKTSYAAALPQGKLR